MKREGRQHGMVRTYPLNRRPTTRFVNLVNSPPTAGLFTKVSSKPTNHSKFTGKCGKARCTSCHLHPARKAKDKTKGTHKVRSCDVVVDGWQQGLNFSGYSASAILDQLEYDDDYHRDVDEYHCCYCLGCYDDFYHWTEILINNGGSGSCGGGDDDDTDDVVDDAISYCDVVFLALNYMERFEHPKRK